jgi:hypothetical protein
MTEADITFASRAEARAFLGAIRVFLSLNPRQENILVFVGGILQESAGLLCIEDGEICPNPLIVGSDHGISPLPLKIKISTL